MATLSLENLTRISVGQYHRMVETGVLTENDKCELLEGLVVDKMPNIPLHIGTLQLLVAILRRLVPVGDWHLRIQAPITLSKSEPEPDIVMARGSEVEYLTRHPGAKDVMLLIEVADSSLNQDQTTKQEIYARAGIGIYWIVNLVQKVVEVYTLPSGPQTEPVYCHRHVYSRADSVSLEIEGKMLVSISVSEIFPKG